MRCFLDRMAKIELVAFALLIGLVLPHSSSGQPEGEGAGFRPIAPLRGFMGQVGPGSLGGREISISAQFFADSAGRRGVLEVTAQLATNWHIYSITQPRGGPIRTEIVVGPVPAVTSWGSFQPLTAPEVKELEFMPVPAEEHAGQVTWRASLEFAEGTSLQTLVINGEVRGQICQDEGVCLPLGGVDTTFAARFAGVADELFADSMAESPTANGAVDAAVVATGSPALMKNILFGLVGGLLLNLMPCVLPVIGLKVMSFIQQSGDNRWRVWQLNFTYAIGIISVFVLLGTLAAFMEMGWGEQFTETWFRVAMAMLVFAMALSFLDVWEIPIPGFVGRGTAGHLAAREGIAGAFFKGVFTTVLATPCSGPFLGPVFGYTLQQPAYITYAIFISVGLGMSSPYLLIGMFPQLMRFLPKPGAWMDTFKQLMAFLLLATVVYLFSTLNSEYFLATFASLIGLWFACWWIGRTAITASFDQKLSSWIVGIVAAGAVMMASFSYLVEGDELIQWQDFSPTLVTNARAEGRTVMVDYTADWCPNCKWNLKFAINTEKVSELVGEYDVLPLLADWTNRSDDIKNSLAELDSRSIPVLALYPAGGSREVIVLRDILTESKVLDAIKEAGPSSTVTDASRTAQRIYE